MTTTTMVIPLSTGWSFAAVEDFVERGDALHKFKTTDGKTVLVGHGDQEGYFCWERDGEWVHLAEDAPPGGILVCCHSKQVAARYPNWEVFLPDWDDTIKVSYLPDGNNSYLEIAPV